jgi:hypothetical protein
MYELTCPACNSPSTYNFSDYLLLCPFCSASFHLNPENGQKEIFGDHFIVPNTADGRAIKELTMEWLKRLHHNPKAAEKEFWVVDIKGISLPYWVVSMEGHTHWKGLAQKNRRSVLNYKPGADFLIENGQFRRSYRWAISARENLCESWGLTRLHEPKEDIKVQWDGFPLDSTLSRGQLIESDTEQKSIYDSREFFDFKYANGLPIMGIQVDEKEALRRAKQHVELYHFQLAGLNCDYLTDYRTELDIAGIQLIHLPVWHASYVYKPNNPLKYFYKPKEKNVILEGYHKGILNGELAIIHNDKVWVNSIISGAATVFLFLLGAAWHPAFYIVALFAAFISMISIYIGLTVKNQSTDEIQVKNGGLGLFEGDQSSTAGKAAS